MIKAYCKSVFLLPLGVATIIILIIYYSYVPSVCFHAASCYAFLKGRDGVCLRCTMILVHAVHMTAKQALMILCTSVDSSHYHLSLNHEGRWGTTDDLATSFLHFFPVLHCPLGLGELQACPFPDVVFPPLPLSALSSSPFHCALQGGFGHT